MSAIEIKNFLTHIEFFLSFGQNAISSKFSTRYTKFFKHIFLPLDKNHRKSCKSREKVVKNV